MSNEQPGIPLLNLTPVCLQNTNNIINTLLFMCLDQGHDFRDGGSRTRLPGGERGWVDIDYDGNGYLNKISKDELIGYANGQSSFTIDSPKIVGNYQFVTGLINTTFMGGKGAYGLVLLNDEYYNMIKSNYIVGSESASTSENDDDVKVSTFIATNLKKKISFYFDILNIETYYLFSNGDDMGGEGMTYSISLDDNSSPETDDNSSNNIVKMLFLPFYKRAYDKGMHKLWDFNTKKHVFVVNLDKLGIKTNAGNFEVADTEIKCEKLTSIDLIVPTYTLYNFVPAKKSKTPTFLDKLIRQLKNNDLFEKDLKLQSLGKLLENPSQEQKEQIVKYFFKELFTGEGNVNQTDAELSQSTSAQTNTPTIEYIDDDPDNIGHFVLKNFEDKKLYECVPRGVKYWFQDSHHNLFKYFIKFLYSYQKPFIHPGYTISNARGGLEASKGIILDKLLNDNNKNLDEYNNYKNYEPFNENSPFILKQYGIIQDTPIGTNKNAQNTTIDFLINSLNNVSFDRTCKIDSVDKNLMDFSRQTDEGITSAETISNSIGGGDEELNFLTGQQRPFVERSINRNPKEIKQIFDRLTDDNKLKLYNYLKNKNVPEKDLNKMYTPVTQPTSEPVIQPTSEPVTQPTSEPVTQPPILTSKRAREEKSDEGPSTKKPKQVYFDNIANVNEVFKLNLNVKELEKNDFVEITSKMQDNDIEMQQKKYDNELQQYYDFIPQNNDNNNMSTPNYFKNCWQSIDFYQENSPTETQSIEQIAGGSENDKENEENMRYKYPFKFTVTSTQIDGSKQGGQSIPQYHPPEVDIYMPIFDLKDKGDFKGIIVRMSFVKDVLGNAINSKSRADVFCHFVYVDFESAGIPSPRNNANKYPETLKMLLDYTIKNTYYINKNDNCIKRENLKNADINADDEIDFIIMLNGNKRNWYKYYSDTYGPSVQDDFVKSSSNENINSIIRAASSVAKRIAQVGEKLITNTQELKTIFGVQSDDKINTHPGAVLFVKLFLIRNKYTGDKSRATDTLFLNQTKYIEGAQISNDENTLFNALMFGQNIIWSTKAKTVFNMAPYLTKASDKEDKEYDGYKMPINGGFYIDELCSGLKGNPSIKVDPIDEDESTENSEETMSETKSELLDYLPSGFQEKVKECKGNDGDFNGFKTEMATLLINYKDFKSEYKKLEHFFNKYDEYISNLGMENFLQNNDNLKGQTLKWDNVNVLIKNTDPAKYSIVGTTEAALVALGKVKGSVGNIINNKNGLQLLFNLFDGKCMKFDDINDIDKFLIYIGKNAHWWNLNKYQNRIKDIYRYMCSKFNCEINEAIKNVSESNKKKVNEFLVARRGEMINLCSIDFCDKNSLFSDCPPANKPPNKLDENAFMLESPTLSDLQERQILLFYLKVIANIGLGLRYDKIFNQVITPTSNLNTSRPKDEDETNRINSYINMNTIKDMNNINDVNKQISEIKEIIKRKFPSTSQNKRKSTDSKPQSEQQGKRHKSDKQGPATIGGMKDDKNIINKEELNSFYRDTYKCNVGNHLKSFINKIKNIEEYVSLNKENDNLNIKENGNLKDVVIQILLKNLDIVNSSHVPKATNEQILNVLRNINNDYNVEKMNTIKNIYSSQFEMYSLIDMVMNIDYDNEDDRKYLVELINENINDIRFEDLRLAFTKQELLDKILNPQELKEDEFQAISQTTLQDENQPTPDTSTKEPIQLKKPELTKKDIPSDLIDENDFSMDYQNKLYQNNFALNNSSHAILSFGGSIKNKRKQITKTKNNKRKNKKRTIKKKTAKVRKYTRRHK